MHEQIFETFILTRSNKTNVLYYDRKRCETVQTNPVVVVENRITSSRTKESQWFSYLTQNEKPQRQRMKHNRLSNWVLSTFESDRTAKNKFK